MGAALSGASLPYSSPDPKASAIGSSVGLDPLEPIIKVSWMDTSVVIYTITSSMSCNLKKWSTLGTTVSGSGSTPNSSSSASEVFESSATQGSIILDTIDKETSMCVLSGTPKSVHKHEISVDFNSSISFLNLVTSTLMAAQSTTTPSTYCFSRSSTRAANLSVWSLYSHNISLCPYLSSQRGTKATSIAMSIIEGTWASKWEAWASVKYARLPIHSTAAWVSKVRGRVEEVGGGVIMGVAEASTLRMGGNGLLSRDSTIKTEKVYTNALYFRPASSQMYST